MTMLKRARTVLESRDYEVPTIRISTQPFPEYTKGLTTEPSSRLFQELRRRSPPNKNSQTSIGYRPCSMPKTPNPQADRLLVEILKNTKVHQRLALVVGRPRTVGALAPRWAQRLAPCKSWYATEHSQGNFKFAATAFVPPLTPFFPASYHTGFGQSVRHRARIRQHGRWRLSKAHQTWQPRAND